MEGNAAEILLQSASVSGPKEWTAYETALLLENNGHDVQLTGLEELNIDCNQF